MPTCTAVLSPKRHQQVWENRFNELLAYKEEKGHCDVPQRRGALGRWVKKARAKYKKGTLSQERIMKLKSIEFNWRAQRYDKTYLKQYDERWEEKFKELVVYKDMEGDCDVRARNGKLGCWVSTLLHNWSRGNLFLTIFTR